MTITFNDTPGDSTALVDASAMQDFPIPYCSVSVVPRKRTTWTFLITVCTGYEGTEGDEATEA